MPPVVAVVKARVETDLADPRVQELVDEAVAEIEERYGPYRAGGTPISVQLDGDTQTLSLSRPVDTAQTVSIVEHVSTRPGGAEESTTLAANDWRSWHGGRTLQRLASGANARWRWGDRVVVTYVPVDDTKQRDEVVIKLVQLAVEFQGVSMRTVGDHLQRNADYQAERERLLGSLAPRGGLLFA